MTSPLVSVLLPVRDAGLHLDACIRSLECQTFDDFEVIAVNDGSTDGSAERLDAWAARDARARILHQPARGLIPTLNTGLARCRGRYVARMDADDVAAHRRLERQVAVLEAEPGDGQPGRGEPGDGTARVDVVSCLVRHIPRQQVAEGFRIYERWLNSLVRHADILRERFIESPLAHPSVMARRRVLAAVGGYREMGWPEDYDLWLRLAAAGARFAKVPETLHFWRDHDARLTRTDRRYAVERFLACKAHHLLNGPLAPPMRMILWGAGQTGRRLSKHLLRGGATIEACLDIAPSKIGRTLRGIPIHDAAELPALWRDDGSMVVITAVSSRGARALIRARLAALGLHEARDYWCAA